MRTSSDVITHWHYSVEGLSTSALEFYKSIEAALAARKVPVTQTRVEWNEGGILSAKREYLRLAYGRFLFDVSAFPFGTDYYFSWWLTKKRPSLAALLGCLGILAVPILWIICVSLAGAVKGTLLASVLIGGMVFLLGQTVREGSSDAAELVLAVPYVGPVFERFFSPTTYYSEDTRIMFEETVHRVVLDVVGGILTINSMKPLSEEEAKPKQPKL